MNHITGYVSERNGLQDMGRRAITANITYRRFFSNFIIFVVMLIILSVQGAQESLQSDEEWLSSGTWGSSLSNNIVHVTKRQAEEREKAAENKNTSPDSLKDVPAGDAVDSDLVTKSSEPGAPVAESVKSEGEQKAKDDSAKDVALPAGSDQAGNTGSEPSDDHKLVPGLKGISSEAVLRGFYVFVGVGTIVLLYIVIKLLRLRRRRATRKYRVLSHNDDQEMFPLAADDGDDEEIYNAVDHQTLT